MMDRNVLLTQLLTLWQKLVVEESSEEMTVCPCPSYRVYKVIILYVNQDSHPCPGPQNQNPLSLPYRQMGSRAHGSFIYPSSLLWLAGSGGTVREKELGRVFLV